MTNDSPRMTDSKPTEASNSADDADRLHLEVADVSGSGEDRLVLLQGTLRIYVKRGSQLSTWQDFPQAILVVAKDVASAKTYETMDISRTGSSDPGMIDEYAKMPANQVVEKKFEISLFQRLSRLPRSGVALDVHVSYLGMNSNVVRVSL